ncbi:MAG: HAD family hydrolase [Clostridia bacterium]|nr:HAD family hydrolase [Clostridia bacterium]
MTSGKNKIKAVLFDLDDTLIDRDKMFSNWVRYFAKNFSSYPPDMLDGYLVKLKVTDSRGAGRREAVFADMMKEFGIDDMAVLEKSYYDTYRDFAEPFCGELETLEKLKKDGYLLGVVSNGYTELQKKKMRNAGLFDYFDEILISEEAGCQKPDKRIFESMAKKLGILPSEALMVGDRYEIDVLGALGAGMRACYMTARIDPDEENDYEYQAEKFEDILNILDKLR